MGMVDDIDWAFAPHFETTPTIATPAPEPKSYVAFESRQWNCYLCGRATPYLMTYRSVITWRLPVCPLCAERWCEGPKLRANLVETE